MSTRTTFEDLARMGHTRRQIFLLCNALRGGTMTNESHLHLNNAWVDQYGWYSYNTVLGEAVRMGNVPLNIEETSIDVEYDNSQNNQSFSEEWETTVQTSTRSTLAIRDLASITLSSMITVANVAQSGFSMQVETESTREEVVERVTTTTRRFTVDVGPHEIVRILRTKAETGFLTTYSVPYGLNQAAMIGTQGRRYNGHYHWGFRLNPLLGNPGGNIVLNGTSRNTSHRFQIVRIVSGDNKSQGVSKAFEVDPATGELLEIPVQDEVASVDDVTNASAIAHSGI